MAALVSYELRIGWRYLYRKDRSNKQIIGAAISAVLAGLGLAWFLASGGTSAWAVLTLFLGIIGTVTFLLLSILSVFTTVSILGVIFGVAALTVVPAVTSGFQKAFQEKVLGVNAHVIVQKTPKDFTEYREVVKFARTFDPQVVSVEPFNFIEMLATRGKGQLSGVAIKGVDPESVTTVLDLANHMQEGSVESLKTSFREQTAAGAPKPDDNNLYRPIIIGATLAKKLHATMGDEITIVAPLSNIDTTTMESNGETPRSMKFRVTGIFYVGFEEYDRRLMYVRLDDSQELWGVGDQVLGVELKLKDIDSAQAVAARLADRLHEKFGGEYHAQDWRALNKALFDALVIQKLVLLIALTLIIMVAAFNMVSALTMLVTDKTREIAILKAMGARSFGVASTFQVVGLAIGMLGTAIGLALGLLLCWVVARYDYQLDPKVYYIDRLPVFVRGFEVALVGCIALLISFVATIFPSLSASRLPPAQGLRYD